MKIGNSKEWLPNKNVIGVIPARYGSTRLPGKPLASISGHPMIEWVYLAARSVLKRVIVATDDKRIFECVKRFGGEVLMTPKSCPSGTDRMAHVARKIKAKYYVNIQGDEPLIHTLTIEKTVRLAVKNKSVATAATFLKGSDENDPHVVKVVVDKLGRALYFSRNFLPTALKHMGLYVYPRKILLDFVRLKPAEAEKIERLEQLRALVNGIPIYVALSGYDSIGVDTKEDLKKVSKHLKDLNRRGENELMERTK